MVSERKSRVSYSVGSVSCSNQHVSSVRALALDSNSGVLYSGGNDASVHAWSLQTDFAELRDDLSINYTHNNNNAFSYRKFNSLSDHISIPPKASLSHSTEMTQSPVQSPSFIHSTNSPYHNYNSQPDKDKKVSFLSDYMDNHTLDYPNTATANRHQLYQPLDYLSFSHDYSDVDHDSSDGAFPRARKWSTKLLPTIHSRSFQAHSDWVNDIVLCNRNQSMVTASNDRMVYLWSTTQVNTYMRLGYHSDHVKCLAYSSARGWVASGGLDRRVLIWDAQEGRDREVMGLEVGASEFCHDKSPKASIYALACNPNGTAIVSGSPDKIIRVWDPRSEKQALKLTGHRDNIRDLLISDDGKWVLSASSDTTIKLWSLAHPQRCMVTYTHYEDSVWCLYSNHPDLDTFWAGGRDGLITKMSRRRVGGGGSSGPEGKGRGDDEIVDCVAVCREDGPVHKLVAVDDMFVWAATDKSSINRWRDIPFHQAIVVPTRAKIPEDTDAIYIPSASIISHAHTMRPFKTHTHNNPDDDNTTTTTKRKTDTSTAASTSFSTWDANHQPMSRTASIISKDRPAQQPPNLESSSCRVSMVNLPHRAASSFLDLDSDADSDSETPVDPVWRQPDHVIQGAPAIHKYRLMNNRMHVVTEDTAGTCSVWDIVKCVKVKQFERGSGNEFEAICEKVNGGEWIAHWCMIDTKNGYLTVHLDESKFYEAEIYYESVAVPNQEDQRINIGKWVLSYLFISYMHVKHQEIPPAAVMYHDHYLGAPTYTHLQAPPDSTSHYLFGQTVYYGPPELEASLALWGVEAPTNADPRAGSRKERIDSLQENSAQDNGEVDTGTSEKKISDSRKLSSEGAQDQDNVKTSVTGNPEASSEDTVQVRPRPRPAYPLHAGRPDSIVAAEMALIQVQQIIQEHRPYAPNVNELPLIRIPPDVPILVSCEESLEAACFLDQFRSTVGQIGWVREAMRLDECIPRWVVDVLTDKKLKETTKMSFTMLAHPYSDLPELPNNANRLSSNRMIRLRKLLAYVAEQAKITPPLALIKAAVLAQQQQSLAIVAHPVPECFSNGSDAGGATSIPFVSDDQSGSDAASESLPRRPIPWNGLVNVGSVEALSSAAAAQANVGSPVPLDSNSVRSAGMGSLFTRRKRSATGGAVSTNSEVQPQQPGQATNTAITPTTTENMTALSLAEVNWKDLIKPEEYLELVCQDRVLDPKMTLGTVKNLVWKSGSGDLTLTYRRKTLP